MAVRYELQGGYAQVHVTDTVVLVRLGGLFSKRALWVLNLGLALTMRSSVSYR